MPWKSSMIADRSEMCIRDSSSTGHMILVDEFVKLNVSAEFLERFLVVIQLGAIMACLLYTSQPRSAMAVASLVLGIVALVTAILPIINNLSFLLACLLYTSRCV